MAHFYADSSALVKRHIFETGSTWFQTLVAATASNPVTTAVIERAKSLLELYPLRAYDAVHLASALLANDTLVTSGLPVLVFVSADHRLLIAAQAEGLATENPNVYP